MRVAGIALDAASRSPIVLLRDPSGRRQVPIWIDQAQAQNIMAGLKQEQSPRPLSHDLMASLMAASELDARPSDAIALALRTGSSIWMLEEVVADASIPVDAEADAEDAADFRRFLDGISPAELVRNVNKARSEAKQANRDSDDGQEQDGEDTPG
jgi:bifunctional DNase/RNase